MFFYYFCLMMEGSGAESVLGTIGSGCGSGRPKNIWILRIRIRNIGIKYFRECCLLRAITSINMSLIFSLAINMSLIFHLAISMGLISVIYSADHIQKKKLSFSSHLCHFFNANSSYCTVTSLSPLWQYCNLWEITKFNYSRPGRVWSVTSRLGTGKSLTFFTVYSYSFPCRNAGN